MFCNLITNWVSEYTLDLDDAPIKQNSLNRF